MAPRHDKNMTTATARPQSTLALAALLAVAAGGAASASTWTGNGGVWSSDGSPGWNGTGVPNAVDATANFISTTVAKGITLDQTATIGTLSYSGSGNTGLTFTLTNAITFDVSSGSASISNTTTGTGSRISFGSGTIVLNDNLTISNTNTNITTQSIIASSNFSGTSKNLTLSNAMNDLAKGVITLSGASSFTGNVLIEKGAVLIGNNTSLGNAANEVTLGSAGNGSATLVSTGTTTNLANNITVASGSGGTLLLGSNNAGETTSTFSGTITLNDSLTVTSVKTGAGTVAFTKAISGGGGITKVGSGAATLSGNNTYTGATDVNEGKLVVNGNQSTATGAVMVASGASLGGTGTLGGAVTVNGTLAPGNSIGTISTGNLAIGATGALDVELGRDTGTPTSDRTNVTGTVTFSDGADLKLTRYTGLDNPELGDIFYLVSNDDSDTIVGEFTKLNGTNTTLSEGSEFTWNSQQWQITYAADYNTGFTGGNDLAIQVVPEPAALALLLIGGVGLLRRRRTV
ncbi:MAG: autotransporter-associated beta strand repeat-containing protein [Lentisphaeria bacterium]|jgi:autotransporter-associated beta strand protein